MEKSRRGGYVKYINAKCVLPPRLLREVQEHFEGLLWVPVRDRRRRKTRRDLERNRRIVEAHRRGVPTSVLARRHNLTPQRIRQIVREAKVEN